MLSRVALVVGLSAASILASAVPAVADGGWGNTDCSQYPLPGCEISAGKHSRPATGGVDNEDSDVATSSGGNASNPYAHCRYIEVDVQDSGARPPEPGAWYMVVCSPDGKDPLTHGPVFLPETENQQVAVSPEQVAQVARNRLRLPEPQIAANPTGDQLVNLPTWLWLSSWQPVSATASVPGVSVTAVARPTSVRWSMGDGGLVTCTGPGSPFPAGGDPKSASPDCGYTYKTSSAGQRADAFPVSATVNWTVTWSGAGQGGTFPNMTTSASVAFRVAESQGIATG